MKYILTHIDNSKLNLHTRTPYSSVLEASVSNIWQGYNELTLKVSVEGVPGWRHFDKIQIDDIDYYLNEWNESEHVDERVSTYTLHFYGPEKMIIEASPLTDMDEDGVSVFRKLTSVTGDLPFFGNMICNCINYRHYDPQTGLRVKQNTVKIGTYPAGTKHLNVDFSESNAFAGLKAICEKFGVSYSLERNTQGDTDYILNFETEQTVFPVTLSYGKGKGLYAIRRKSLNTKNIKTILTVLGSSKNLPTDYGKNNLELDPTLYPGSIIADATKIAKYGAWNEIYQNEEIMPSRLGTITAIDESDVLSFIDTTLDFDPTGGTVNIVTGQLAGNNFKIKKYSSTTNKITVEPLTDENGFTKPSVAPYLFAPGDEYYLVDIPMPGSYLIAAQEELAEAGNAEYDRISQPQVAYEVSLHGKFLRKHEVRPRVGMYLPISDVRWGVDKAILITKVKRDLLKRDDWEYECEISDDPGESLAVCLYKKIQQTGINTRKQEKNQISTIAALRSFTEEKASESLMASQAYAAAQAEAARVAAQVYADGEIDAEETRAIADATAKMNEAKSYALAQAAAAESAAKTYAEAQAAAAQAAAEAVAEAEAESAEISAKAYADGVVSAEEQRAIAEAAAKLTEAKNYAESQAAAAEAAANTYSEAQAEAARLAAIASAKTYTDTEVTAAKGYADSTAAAAQSAAEAYALAKANLAETNAEAYADGVVDAEESARIADAQAKLNEAKTYAEQKATTAENAAKAYADTQLGNFATTVTGSLSDLQNQIDGSITTHFYAYIPTTSNAPASGWTTTALKNQHIGDLFYVNNDSLEEDGFCYRWTGTAWELIKDTQITKALADAAAAQDTADSKRRVFVATPTTPYDIGDLWLKSGDLYKCKVTRLTGSYVASDWEKGVKYTDDTVANANLVTAKAYADTKKAEAIAAAEDYAEAEALAAKTAAEAHADGIVTAEEAARIADVNAKLAAAQSYAETKASEAQTAAQNYAATAASNAQSAAQTYALAKANLAETTAKAYADGVVSDEETRAIADATAKMNEAKAHAETKATEAKNAAEAAAALDATAKANAAKSAAETYALAKANLAETTAKAYADGIVDAEEARAIADATAKANAAKAAAEATAAALDDAIQVGGRNLIPNFNSDRWKKLGTSVHFEIDSDRKARIYGNGASSSNRIGVVSYELEPNTEYLLSGNILATEGSYFCFRTKLDTVNSRSNYSRNINFLTATVGKKEIQFTTTSDEVAIYIEIGSNTNADSYDITIQNIKLEKGNKATDWTPAPEDVQAEIDAANAAAEAAQSTANAASTAATNAQTSATTANNLLSDIANDNKFTPLEKQETKKEWDAIVSEKTKNDSQADTFGVSKTAYGTAYTALSNYITPLLSSLTTTSNITGTTFRSTFKAYYDARTDLLNAIAAKARTLANTAQTTANNAATAAAAAVTTAASDATAKMNAAKDAIAQEAGYTNFADMASKAALTVNGLLNSNIINTDQIFANKLLAFSAFIDYLRVKQLETDADTNGWTVRIDNSSTGFIPSIKLCRRVDGVIVETAISIASIGGIPQMIMNCTGSNCDSIIYTENGITFNLPSGTFSITPEGIEAKNTEGDVILSFMFNITSGLSTIKIGTLSNAYNSSNPTMVWKDSKGFLRIGAAVAYTAADVGAVPTSRTVNGKALSANITLSASDVGAAPASHTHAYVPTSRKVNNKALSADISLTAADVGAVPTSRTVNGKALSANISLSATDVGAAAASHSHAYVPTSRTVNSKALSANITLSASDVGAAPASHTHSYVPTSRKVNNKALSANITLSASDVGALASNAIQYFTQAQWDALSQAQKDAVPLAVVGE